MKIKEYNSSYTSHCGFCLLGIQHVIVAFGGIQRGFWEYKHVIVKATSYSNKSNRFSHYLNAKRNTPDNRALEKIYGRYSKVDMDIGTLTGYHPFFLFQLNSNCISFSLLFHKFFH
jgi:hypothetical protein